MPDVLPARFGVSPWGVSPWAASDAADGVQKMSHSASSVSSAAAIPPISDNDMTDAKPLEELMYQVLEALAQEEEKATLILRDAVVAERQWQKELMERLEKEHSVYYTHEKRHDMAKHIADVVLPLSLVAQGMVGIFTGGVGLIPLGAATLGAVMAVDAALDNAGKKALASCLGRNQDEDTTKWLQRIYVGASLTMFGMGLCVQGEQAVALATNISRFTTECTEVGTQRPLDLQKARLIESEKQWDDAGMCIKEMLGNIEHQVQTVNNIFVMLADLQKSTTRASAQIFQKV